MTRLRLNWVTQLSMLAFAVGCGSSNSSNVSNSILSNVGGQDATTVGGTGNPNGGKNSTAGTATNGGANSNGGANGSAGNGSSNTAGNGSGTAGSNSLAGNSSGTGSTGSTTNGGSGSGLGGDAYGGDGTIVGGSGFGTTGGAGSVDVKLTGGTGSSVDVSSGGSGSSVDVATGGGWSIDTGSGGGTSIDIATGGGGSVDMGTGGGGSVDKGTGGGSSIDKATGGGGSVDLGTGGGTSIDHGCFVTTLGDINVYVTIDATPSGADTEGKLYVGGNLTASGYSVGAKSTLDCTKYSLVVGGNVALTGGSVRAGMAYYGGTSGTASATNFDCGGLKRGKPIDFPALKLEVEDLSLKLSKLPVTNCTVSRDAGGALVLTATNTVFSVCSIDASQLGNVKLNFPAGSSVAVNVSGTSATWSGAAVCLNGECADSAQANQVVWNFYQATSLYATGIAIQGSILAPLATLDGGGGHIAGQLIVKYLKGGLEYHPYMFSGCIKWPTTI